jgi:hypothetical protein
MTTEISMQTQPRGLALQTFSDAMKFGEHVANSDFAPKDFRGKPASCMLAMQCGAEIGLAPLQSLQSIAVVNGRPAVYGDAALAVVKASAVCEYVTEQVEGDGDQMVATCTAKRRNYPSATVVRFGVADAKKAGLWGKSGPWTQYPKRMLQMRARGFALRDAFPDVLKGLVTAEEAQDYPTHDTAGVRQQEPANATVEAHIKKAATSEATPEATVYEKAAQSIAKAKTMDRLDDIRRKVAERLADKSLTKWEHDSLSAAVLEKAALIDSGVEHFDGQEVEAEART